MYTCLCFQLGPNGYAFAINSNGYIIFHPNLQAAKGFLDHPPNVDLLDVEADSGEKEEVSSLDIHWTYTIVNNESRSF